MAELEFLQKIADGSAAEAFLAREAGSAQNVLVELSRPALADDSELYGRFLDEARELQKLAHPHVLRRTSTGCQNDGRLYVVTEPIGGVSLAQTLKESGPLAPLLAVKLLSQVCEGVAYLHSRGMVHGHLRPANVFLGADGEPKLLDMGLLLFRTARSMRTPTNLVLVAPEYLSPERIKGHRASPLSDVYGLGVLLYELISGHPPFSGERLEDTRQLHLTAPVPWLPPGTEQLASVIGKCLAKDPQARFGSALELKAALLALPADLPAKAVERGATVSLRAPGNDLPIVEGKLETSRQVLGSYELLELLGEGGMGRVYLARHLKLDRKVAIKVLKPELAQVEQQVQRFFQEALAVNRVNHPHIVEIQDFIEERSEGRVWCVMEYLPGQSLKEVGKAGPLKVARAVRVVQQVAQALAAAHKVGVVHRDIKPDNIHLVEGRGVPDFVKVLDFGIAKLKDPREQVASNTLTGEVIGTPAYMSPEQALGLDVDARSDLYSLGTVLYVLLAGRFPFDGSSASQIVANLITQPPRPLGSVSISGEELADGLQEIVHRCLDKLPQARFQTMDQLEAALAEFAGPAPTASGEAWPMVVDDTDLIQITEAPLELPRAGQAAGLPAPRRARGKAWLVTLAVLAAAGAAAAWWNGVALPFGARGVAAHIAEPSLARELRKFTVEHGPVQTATPVEPARVVGWPEAAVGRPAEPVKAPVAKKKPARRTAKTK